MASSSSYSGCRDRGKGTLTDISASCLHILIETSSSQRIDDNSPSSRGTKRRKIAGTDAVDQEMSQKMSPLRRGICEHGRQRYTCKECGGAIKKKQ